MLPFICPHTEPVEQDHQPTGRAASFSLPSLVKGNLARRSAPHTGVISKPLFISAGRHNCCWGRCRFGLVTAECDAHPLIFLCQLTAAVRNHRVFCRYVVTWEKENPAEAGQVPGSAYVRTAWRMGATTRAVQRRLLTLVVFGRARLT